MSCFSTSSSLTRLFLSKRAQSLTRYLNLTTSVSLPNATIVHVVDLGGHTVLLEADNATLVTVLDAVAWIGAVDVRGSAVREPAGRYVISLDGTAQCECDLACARVAGGGGDMVR